jgi:hypothetical protein
LFWCYYPWCWPSTAKAVASLQGRVRTTVVRNYASFFVEIFSPTV